MKDNSIKEIENEVDSKWENLTIFNLPMYQALFLVLAAYEEYNWAIKPHNNGAGMVNLRGALEIIIPKLYDTNPQAILPIAQLASIRSTKKPLFHGEDSMNFSQKYAWIAYHLTGYHQGWFLCEAKDFEINFTMPVGVNAGLELLHNPLAHLKEKKALVATKEKNLNTMTARQRQPFLEKIFTEPLNEWMNKIPDELFADCRKWVSPGLGEPTIERTTIFTSYSVEDFYQFSIAIFTLASCHLIACEKKFSDKELFKNCVLILRKDELAKTLSQRANLSIEVTENIIRDLTLNPKQQRPDCKVRYLMPINGTNYVMTTPHLIFTSNWEVCLLRNWANMSPALYGELVGSKKIHMANRILPYIRNESVVVATNKKIVGKDGKTRTDVDFAAFDTNTGFLLISELKWIIPPDSFQEESHARAEIDKGCEQLKFLENYSHDHKGQLVSELFPKINLDAKNINEIHFCLFSDGYVTGKTNLDQTKCPILDFTHSLETLSNNLMLSLKDKFQLILASQNSMEQTINNNLCSNTMKLGGYIWRFPGEKSSTQGITYTKKETSISPGSRCLCGSGLKYSDCCLKLEKFREGH